MSRFSGKAESGVIDYLPVRRPVKRLSLDALREVSVLPSPSWLADYLERIEAPDEPGDHLEEALLSVKPGTKSGEQIAIMAMVRAGIIPPKPDLELITVAQDLVDNDSRIEGDI